MTSINLRAACLLFRAIYAGQKWVKLNSYFQLLRIRFSLNWLIVLGTNFQSAVIFSLLEKLGRDWTESTGFKIYGTAEKMKLHLTCQASETFFAFTLTLPTWAANFAVWRGNWLKLIRLIAHVPRNYSLNIEKYHLHKARSIWGALNWFWILCLIAVGCP